MNTKGQRLASYPITVAAALLLLLASPAAAEVGVIHKFGQEPTLLGPYEFATIIEDSDPVGIRWRPHPYSGTNRVVLNPDGEHNGDGRPSSLYNSFSQLPMVTWAKNTPSGFDVVLSYFINGAWSDPVVLCQNATSSHDAEPNLVINPDDGSVHLLYWTDDGPTRIMHRQAPSDLSSWSDPAEVSETGEIAVRPSGVFHQGVLKVVYESHAGQVGGTPRHIVLATENGGAYSTEILATTSHANPNRPRIHSASGTLWIEWFDAEGVMAWTSRVSPDPWNPVEQETYASAEERDYHIRGKIKGLVLD